MKKLHEILSTYLAGHPADMGMHCNNLQQKRTANGSGCKEWLPSAGSKKEWADADSSWNRYDIICSGF